jgi:XTP/dITP diphosphohydrolase
MKIILASGNKGKIKELQIALQDLPCEIIPQSDYKIEDAEETGLTFVENALIKARHACQQTGLPALADDSGLIVPALQGAPGIYSARYAGVQCTSTDNIQKLLHEMRDVPEGQRHAAFHCVLVFMLHAEDPTPLICEGTWVGSILSKTQGQEGFGYDPVFFDANLQSSAAQLPIETKNKISHRGKALQILVDQLSKLLQ